MKPGTDIHSVTTEDITFQETGTALPDLWEDWWPPPLGPLELSPRSPTERKEPSDLPRGWNPLGLQSAGFWPLPVPNWHGASTFVHYFYCYFIYFLAVLRGMWDLGSAPGIKPVPLALEAQSLNHQNQGS